MFGYSPDDKVKFSKLNPHFDKIRVVDLQLNYKHHNITFRFSTDVKTSKIKYKRRIKKEEKIEINLDYIERISNKVQFETKKRNDFFIEFTSIPSYVQSKYNIIKPLHTPTTTCIINSFKKPFTNVYVFYEINVFTWCVVDCIIILDCNVFDDKVGYIEVIRKI